MKKEQQEKSFTMSGEKRSKVYEEEAAYLRNRRSVAGTHTTDRSGIAFSGGGIRSACFSLGILNWLERSGMWKEFDYVSSVSGGGYAVASVLEREFDGEGSGKTRAEMVVDKLRHDDGYLRSKSATLFLLVISASISGLLTFSPIMLLCGQSASLMINIYPRTVDNWASGIFCAASAVISLSTWRMPGMVGKLTLFIAVFFGSIQVAWVTGYLPPNLRVGMGILLILSWLIVLGLLGLGLSHPLIKRIQRASFLGLMANIVLTFAIVLHLVIDGTGKTHTNDVLACLYIVSLGLIFLALLASPNRLNPFLVTYYKSLQTAFGNGRDDAIWRNRAQQGDPIHLINCFVQSPRTREEPVRSRGGENFCISRFFCGSQSLDYFRTATWSSGREKKPVWRHQTIWRLITTSGAAVDVHPTRQSPIVNGLPTMFNIGLCSWVINPSFKRKHRKGGPVFVLNFAAAVGGNSIKQKWIRLSDGGHFENLGLYELVARQCMDIIVVDAGCDPEYRFSDLALAMEKCRDDFGAEIDIPGLFPQRSPGRCHQSKFEGYIRYRGVDKPAKLTYLKLVVTEHHSMRMRLQSSIDPKFPHEPTRNQFSTKAFVDAYYQLGCETAALAFPVTGTVKRAA
ncbi:hypothetical protein PQQ51_19120 [Paraburkholderia xenovorans]|uniref:hypothetical protein n=1 Tax=Paraburkholderia xenovorans TaxID=36873 RepID=UPI0038BDF41E